MCGIAGIYNYKSQCSVELDILQNMVNITRHRGPDDQGYHIDHNIGLGMSRLAIIDLSQDAHQPMSNEDGRFWIVYNGEVYNCDEIRHDLEEQGHKYRSKSDTESVLHLYEEYGKDCLKKLMGMFAFAIWDSLKRNLFLAVDRVGIKPLYYTRANGSFIFGSELKAILMHPDVKREINPFALDEYISLGCISAPQTIFKNIHRLAPGHFLTFENGEVSINPYWDIRFMPDHSRSETEWIDTFREILIESVRMRLMSDVPLGVLLSGGMDSSSIVAFMNEVSSTPVKTFTIGFKTSELDFKGYDERSDARILSRHFGTEHHELVVEPRLTQNLPDIVWHFDEPFANATAIPTYYLAEMTKRHVTVALCGVGGDEVFGGYPRYPTARWLPWYFRLPKILRNRFLPVAANRLPEGSSEYLLSNRIKKFFNGLGSTPQSTYKTWMSISNGRFNLYSPAMKECLAKSPETSPLEHAFENIGDWEFINQVFFVDLKTYLPNNLLTYMDRMSMAHSLEVRVPFCDHKIIELAALLPPELKCKGMTLKYLLKEVMHHFLPLEIMRKRKQGFSVPIAHWLRHELRELAEWVFSSNRLRQRGYFDPGAVNSLWQVHLSGKANHASVLWAIIVFDLWCTLYLDQIVTSKPDIGLSAFIGA